MRRWFSLYHARSTPLKTFHNLAETLAPDGARLTLHEHDGDYFLKLNGRQLMSSTSTVSELLLAQLACEFLRARPGARVLIGGLGLGYSLRKVLEMVPRDAEVHVAELLGDVVQWNRDFLRPLNGELLDDPRVKVIVEDVTTVIRRAASEPYDAILLDVDNGPTSFVQAANARIYSRRGLTSIRNALTRDGVVTFWSATEEPTFINHLKRARLDVRVVEAKAHERAKRNEHRIYVATRE